MAIAAFEDRAPDVPHVTPYDECHHRTYWRLLDAAEEDADWQEAVRIIFEIDPTTEPDRARTIGTRRSTSDQGSGVVHPAKRLPTDCVRR